MFVILLVLLVVASSTSCSNGCLNEKGTVIWVRQADSSTFVNGCKTEASAWDILSFYCTKGYNITHHAMSDQIKWYSYGVQHYSWTIVSY